MNRGRHNPPARQAGVAVITALLVVTIATVLAVEIAWQTNLDLRRTSGLMAWDQAREYAYFGETVAIGELERLLQEKQYYDRSTDQQARRGLSIVQDDKSLAGGFSDLQGRFNLNNLVTRQGKPDELVIKQFRRLVEAVASLNPDLQLGPAEVEVIVGSTVDWIDPDSTADFNGAEDDFYTSEVEPYRAANGWFTSVSELRAVRGVTPEIYEALKPYLAALPVGSHHTLVNFNTASLPVLMSLGDNVSLENANRWVEDSLEKPVEDVQLVAEGLIDPAMVPYIGYTSSYFEVTGFISIGTNRLDMYSLLEWNGQVASVRLRRFGVVESSLPADATLELGTDAEGKVSVSGQHE
ncbi:Type II secretion system protein K [Gammaproteobacteria bacterium]|nr:type II secretion system minor pseudopilin GspK [Gammaproteobacteria bacterium]CAG0944973.1 Type II secretion system protein K [Gammaproteobacteria bacterium]